jgi:hypothetical protein
MKIARFSILVSAVVILAMGLSFVLTSSIVVGIQTGLSAERAGVVLTYDQSVRGEEVRHAQALLRLKQTEKDLNEKIAEYGDDLAKLNDNDVTGNARGLEQLVADLNANLDIVADVKEELEALLEDIEAMMTEMEEIMNDIEDIRWRRVGTGNESNLHAVEGTNGVIATRITRGLEFNNCGTKRVTEDAGVTLVRCGNATSQVADNQGRYNCLACAAWSTSALATGTPTITDEQLNVIRVRIRDHYNWEIQTTGIDPAVAANADWIALWFTGGDALIQANWDNENVIDRRENPRAGSIDEARVWAQDIKDEITALYAVIVDIALHQFVPSPAYLACPCTVKPIPGTCRLCDAERNASNDEDCEGLACLTCAVKEFNQLVTDHNLEVNKSDNFLVPAARLDVALPALVGTSITAIRNAATAENDTDIQDAIDAINGATGFKLFFDQFDLPKFEFASMQTAIDNKEDCKGEPGPCARRCIKHMEAAIEAEKDKIEFLKTGELCNLETPHAIHLCSCSIPLEEQRNEELLIRAEELKERDMNEKVDKAKKTRNQRCIHL